MSLIKPSYSDKIGFSPLEHQKNTPHLMSIVLLGVTLIHIALAFYLLKKTPIAKTDPILLMSIEMQSPVTTPSAVVNPSPIKAPEKPKAVKTPTVIKKPTPPLIKVKEAEPIPVESPAPAPKPEILTPPAPPVPATTPPTQNNTPASSNTQPPTTANVSSSSSVIPLFRVPPEYPSSATRHHIEGWVKIEFTVKTDGTVDNAVVISAEPEDIFNEAALAAIKKWKFKEKIVDGTPVTQRAVQKLQFKLEH